MGRLALSRRWVLAAVGLAAVLVFANALPLGFALDDDPLIPLNPIVTEGDLRGAVTGPYWRMEREWGYLWRPVTLGSFALEWGLWGGSPLGYHAVNVAVHGLVAVLVAVLLLGVVPPVAALLGGLVFAVHPVHVEAVANVAGRSELYAAAAYLGACLLFLRRAGSGERPGAAPGGAAPASAGWGAARLLGVAALYFVALGAKEIAVTLPAALALLAVHPATRGERAAPDRSASPARALLVDLPLFALLAGVLGFYLVLRLDVLGSVVGEQLPDELVGTTPLQRAWTALALWPEYMRLMLFPADLVADYGPGVFVPPEGFGPRAAAGVVVVAGLLALAVATWRRAPAVSLGIAWFVVTVLPVAHVGVHAGVLLAERTLYLPSVGLALAVGGGVRAWLGRREAVGIRRVAVAAGLVLALLAARTVTRTPVWDSTFTLFRDLAGHHPESHRALRLYGDLLVRSGDVQASARAFDEAARLHPRRYPVLTEAGAAWALAGDTARAEELFRRAIETAPRSKSAYRLLAELHLKGRDGRAAHRVAVEGLARAGSDRELWALLSESYLLKGDLEAALRARRAALGVAPRSRRDWTRLAVILEAAGDTLGAREARARADAL